MYKFNIVNIDTDSIMVNKSDGIKFTESEQQALLSELNGLFPEFINWEDDGYYKSVVVIKAKNYALLSEGDTKIKLKGSSIKDAKKEPALREMMKLMIETLIHSDIKDSLDKLKEIYTLYIKEASNPKDISRWSQKKTVTESVMNCKGYEDLDDNDEDSPRKNETDVYNAIKNEEGLQQGDKVYLYPIYIGKVKKTQDKRKRNKETGLMETIGQVEVEKDVYGLKLSKYYNNDIVTDKLIKRVYDTIKIFELVINIEEFPKYHNKTNKLLLEELLNESK